MSEVENTGSLADERKSWSVNEILNVVRSHEAAQPAFTRAQREEIKEIVREVVEEREAATAKIVPGYNQILLDSLRRVEEEVLNSMQRSAEGQKIIGRHARRPD